MKIVIGGFIGSGKSTISRLVAKSLDIDHVEEYSTSDPILKTSFEELLDWQYSKRPYGNIIFQFYTLIQSAKRQMEKENYVMDRDLYEHRVFAVRSLSPNTIEHASYYMMSELYLSNIEKPTLYVILSISWDTFLERMLARGRKEETDNFDINMEFFKELHSSYIKDLIYELNQDKIPYVVIDANPNSVETVHGSVMKVIYRCLEDSKSF